MPTEIPGKLIQGDVIEILSDDWDLIIAHPPCTYLSKAGARFMYPKAGILNRERFDLAIKAKDFFEKFLYNDCNKVAIENPTPLKVIRMPLPT